MNSSKQKKKSLFKKSQLSNFKENKTARIPGPSPEFSDCLLAHTEQFLENENIENLLILDNIRV